MKPERLTPRSHGGHTSRDVGGSFVFISYARADQDYVDDLIEHLAAHGVVARIDRDTRHGQRWPKVIRDRIDGCAALLVVMTPSSDESEWVEREIRRAQQQAKLILPLLLDGLPFFELNTTQYDDVSDRRMPTPSLISRLQHLTSTEPAATTTPASVPERGPTAYQFWFDEGRRLLGLEQPGPAVIALDRAHELEPGDPDALAFKAWALNELGDHDGALAASELAIEVDPHNARGHNNRGWALIELSRYQEALAACDRAIELDPAAGYAHINRGSALAELGRSEEALLAFDDAIKYDADDPVAHAHRAAVLTELGRHEEALKADDRALELTEDDAAVNRHRRRLFDEFGEGPE